MISWNTKAITDHFAARHQSKSDVKARCKLFDETIGSVNKRQIICNYHRDQFQNEYSAFIPLTSGMADALDIISNDTRNEQNVEIQMFIACAAHAVGYMQSAHSIIDTMSHIIYYGLDLENDTTSNISAHEVSMAKIEKWMQKTESHSELRNSIQAWKCIDGYMYLQDFTNLVKHRYLVSVGLSIDLFGASGRSHGLQFVSFSKDGRNHTERYVDEFFELFNSPFFTGVVKVGRQLNKSLGISP